MTGQRSIEEVLLPHVRLFRSSVGDKFVFMDDNATCHRCSGLSRQRGQVAGRNYPPTNKNTLIRALTEEWDKLPQQLLDNVVQTTRGLLVTYHVILNHGQVTWTTPELAPPSLNYHTTPKGGSIKTESPPVGEMRRSGIETQVLSYLLDRSSKLPDVDSPPAAA
ncbi:hypothetical protein TNCV_3675491 [Trichonephila clavipes]|nr:hypothetical protein TNCV_3675491 [Trichonephila clavipes]